MPVETDSKAFVTGGYQLGIDGTPGLEIAYPTVEDVWDKTVPFLPATFHEILLSGPDILDNFF